MNKIIALLLFISCTLSISVKGQVTVEMEGSGNVISGGTYSYAIQFKDGNNIISPPDGGVFDWYAFGGSVMSSTESTVSIQWHSSGYLQYTMTVNGQSYTTSISVTVSPDTPPVPNTTFQYGYSCGSTTITRLTSPPQGVNYEWWWQTTSNGTSTLLGKAASIVVTAPNITYYLRARSITTPYVWSSTSLSVGTIRVDQLSSAGIISPAQISVFGSFSGQISLSGGLGEIQKWEQSTDGLLWNEIYVGTPTSLSRSTDISMYYRAWVKNGTCPQVVSQTSHVTVEANPVISANKNWLGMGTVTLDAGEGYNTYAWKNVFGDIVGTGQKLEVSTAGYYTAVVGKQGVVGTGTSQSYQVEDQFRGDRNYIVQEDILINGISEISSIKNLLVADKKQVVQYFDGLGRVEQTISTQSSAGKQDLVQPVCYDEFGRELIRYLPYASGENGRYKLDFYNKDNSQYASSSNSQYQFYQTAVVGGEAKPYFVTVVENGPLNRVLKQGHAGVTWQPDGDPYSLIDRTTKSRISVNQGDEVLLWRYAYNSHLVSSKNSQGILGYYALGTLQVRKLIDEHTRVQLEYFDSNGRVVLKRVQSQSQAIPINDTNYASTYYVYDDFGNLRVVVPPEAVGRLAAEYHNATSGNQDAFLARWAFRYRYDARNRMIEKQVPGAAAVYMVYDNRDRLVLTQDGNQRATNQWTFTKYDAFNRPVLTGFYTAEAALSQAAMQQRVNDYYNALATNSGAWYETYIGNGTSNVHGYDNKSFPVVTDPAVYLTATYYDNYQFLSYFNQPFAYKTGELPSLQGYSNQEASANMQVIGQVTGTKVRSLTTATWFESVTYYDQKYRPIQVIAENIKGYEVTTNTYDFVGKVERTKTSLYAGQPVQWTNLVNAVVQGENVRATGSASWSAGASSAQSLPAGIDGWIEVTVDQASLKYFFGLSDVDVDVSTASIDYSFYLNTGTLIANGVLPLDAQGNPSNYSGNYLVGDVLRIERVNGVIYYKRNGLVVAQSATASTSSLVFDLSIQGNGVPFSRPRLSSAFSVPSPYASTSSFTKRMTYDHAGRLVNTYHQVNNEAEVLLAKNEYNELGQLVDKKLHSANGTNFKQSVDYRYNIRGWLTSINNGALQSDATNDDSNDLFGMNLYYNEDAGTGNASADPTQDLRQYNGNISAIRWNKFLNQGTLKGQAYNYKYDAMNRLKQAIHRQTYNGSSWSDGEYDENIPAYDLNGNIQQLQRKGKGNVLIDDLVYNYGVGTAVSNKLLWVTDNVTNAVQKPKGFLDGNTSGNDYTYDVNGNMTTDRNKGITGPIAYNYLNLPQTITRSNNVLNYIYDATGRKLAQVVSTGSSRKNTEYVGPWVFENGELQFLQHDEGRVVLASRKLLFRDDGTNSSLYTPTASMTVSQEIVNGETYVKVSASNGVAIDQLGVSTIGGTFWVNGGERYLLRVKGYTSSSRLAHLRVKVGSSNLVWPGAVLGTGPENEMWVESNFIIPSGATQMTLGVLYKTTLAASNDYIRINELELYKLENSSSEYQYQLKDHLGNVRLTFTAKEEQEVYTATFENNTQTTELQNFRNYSRVTYNDMDHTDEHGTAYDKSQLLNGGYIGQVGLAKSFAVMPGDKVKVDVWAKYLSATGNSGSLSTFATSLLGAFGLSAPAPGETGTAASALNSYGVFIANGGKPGNPNAPSGWVSVLVFDSEYNMVDLSYKQLDGGASGHELLTREVTIKEPGYVYLYLSNEGNVQQDIYFDDMTVTFTKGPIVQMEDYYPFGLVFNSYSRENSTPNNFLYNGKELQDELSLGWYDYQARQYDPTIARWMAIDPLADLSRKWSPYTYCYNSPLIFVDPDGMFGDYYNEKGEHLGSDGIDDNKVYQTTDQAFNENVTEKSFASSSAGGPDYEGLKSSSDTHYLGETNEFGLIQLTGMGNEHIENYGNEDTYSYTDSDGKTVAAGQHGDDWVTPEVGAAFNAAVNEFVAQEGNENITIKVNDASAFNPAKDLGHKTHFSGKSIDMPFIKADGSSSNSISSLSQADKTKTGDFTKILSDKGFSRNYSYNGTISNTSHAAGHTDHLHVGKP